MLRVKSGDAGDAPTVLCVGAHCDDIEIGCGGTLLRWAREHPRARFRWVIFGGEPGRSDESRAAGRRLMAGVDFELTIHDFRTSYFPTQLEALKDAFEALKARLKPDLILTHRLEDRHQDHAALAQLTWNTFRSHTILEYEIPKYEGDLGQPNVFVSLPEADLDEKLDVLLDCFPSQRPRSWFTAETFRSLARLRGIECAAPSGYAEAFHARKLRL